jgi:hypothetical protein
MRSKPIFNLLWHVCRRKPTDTWIPRSYTKLSNISSATVFTLHEKAFNANAVFLKVPFDYRDFFGQLVALIARRAQAFHGNDFPRFILDNYWGTYSDRTGPF